MKNWLKSSMDSNQVSNRVRGAALAVSGTILFIAKINGVPLSESELVESASQLGIVAGGLWFLYGWVMSVVMRFNK